MARTTHGGAYEAQGRDFLRVTIAAGQRLPKALPWVTAADWAAHAPGSDAVPVRCVRARDVQELVNRYRAAGADAEMVEALVRSAASADAPKLAAVRRAVAGFCEGKIPKAAAKTSNAKDTIRGIGERWTNGELHRLHPDHVREKASAVDDEYRLETLCETGIGDIPLSRLTLTDADAAMSNLDATRQRIEGRRAKARAVPARKLAPLGPGGRRQYAQMVSRICAMAVYPLRLIAVSPIPKGWLPRVPNDKAKGLVYPNEERAFLADAANAIHWRLFFGALARLGFRADEAASLTIANVDIERGIVVLDENKTDDPRAPTYVDVAGFVAALTWWKKTYRAGAADDAPFFVQPNGERIRVDGLAHRYRTMLETTIRATGLYREALFVGGDRRMKVRVHDLRGAFVTYALASGRTETWVMDRTGHRSSHGEPVSTRRPDRGRSPARRPDPAQRGDPRDHSRFGGCRSGCEGERSRRETAFNVSKACSKRAYSSVGRAADF